MGYSLVQHFDVSHNLAMQGDAEAEGEHRGLLDQDGSEPMVQFRQGMHIDFEDGLDLAQLSNQFGDAGLQQLVLPLLLVLGHQCGLYYFSSYA